MLEKIVQMLVEMLPLREEVVVAAAYADREDVLEQAVAVVVLVAVEDHQLVVLADLKAAETNSCSAARAAAKPNMGQQDLSWELQPVLSAARIN